MQQPKVYNKHSCYPGKPPPHFIQISDVALYPGSTDMRLNKFGLAQPKVAFAYFSDTCENTEGKEKSESDVDSVSKVPCRKSVTSASCSRLLLGCFSSPTSQGKAIPLCLARSRRQRGQLPQPAVCLPQTHPLLKPPTNTILLVVGVGREEVSSIRQSSFL